MRCTTRAQTPAPALVPPALARPRAHRDLLLPPRLDRAEPAWHAEHFGLSGADANERRPAHGLSNALLFCRYSAKLGYELEFWSRFATEGATPEGYEERLTAGDRHPVPAGELPLRHGRGLLLCRLPRAWIRSASCVPTCGARSRSTGGGTRRREHSSASSSTRHAPDDSEEIAERIGFDPLDTGPLVSELSA